jgi:hypothetical protein
MGVCLMYIRHSSAQTIAIIHILGYKKNTVMYDVFPICISSETLSIVSVLHKCLFNHYESFIKACAMSDVYAGIMMYSHMYLHQRLHL